ncbi:MAG: hypothetical protein COB38_02080 [Gammaproteobacteria bacterium]|nr:MAG: hypothetical protein COB38_10785 [Gammaproteobacteria bacterium]PCI72963.1 MAG: hypothetical protein COB38_02080 [Gammaproteobacteria bacterium]
MKFLILFLAILSSIVLFLQFYWNWLIAKEQIKNGKELNLRISIYYFIWPALFWALYLTVLTS